MDIREYISTVNQKYRAGNATEHTYRDAPERLMLDIDSDGAGRSDSF